MITSVNLNDFENVYILTKVIEGLVKDNFKKINHELLFRTYIDLDDIIQEVLIRVWKYNIHFSKSNEYLKKVTASVLYDMCRLKKQVKTSDMSNKKIINLLIDHSKDVELEKVEEDFDISSLKPIEKLILKYMIEGLSILRIAKELKISMYFINKSINNIKNTLTEGADLKK